MASGKFNLGTRNSQLARTQSEQVKEWLEARGVSCDLIGVESAGDQDSTTPLYQLDGTSPGFFTKQLEIELLAGRIDIAVHSLKDLPTEQPPGLQLACVPRREAAGDCLILRKETFQAGQEIPLPRGATVGTSSLRREAELLALRPDLKITSLRGNVPTRVRAVQDASVDAVVLAQAGLLRLALPLDGLVKVDLSEDVFVPAPAQGALGIETRQDLHPELAQALNAMNDIAAFREAQIERRVLRALEGGCSLPLGVRCQALSDGKLRLRAFLGLQRDREQAPKDWVSFHRFDISELKEETLVDKTVDYFKEVMNAAR